MLLLYTIIWSFGRSYWFYYTTETQKYYYFNSGKQPLPVPAERHGRQPSIRGQPQPEGDGLRQDVQTVRCQCLNSVTWYDQLITWLILRSIMTFFLINTPVTILLFCRFLLFIIRNVYFEFPIWCRNDNDIKSTVLYLLS